MGCPLAPVHKGARGEEAAGQGGRAKGGVLLPPGVGLPSFLVGIGEGGKEEEEGKERGGRRPPSLVLFGLGRGGARSPLLPPSLFSLEAHVGPITPGGVPVTSRCSGKMPISPGMIPMSKYRLPIYQSLCLHHFETPRHVRDHIQDSELPSVHQNT